MLKNTRSVLRIPCPAPSLSSASSFNPKENPLRPRSRCALYFPFTDNTKKKKQSAAADCSLFYPYFIFRSAAFRAGKIRHVTFPCTSIYTSKFSSLYSISLTIFPAPDITPDFRNRTDTTASVLPTDAGNAAPRLLLRIPAFFLSNHRRHGISYSAGFAPGSASPGITPEHTYDNTNICRISFPSSLRAVRISAESFP